MVSIDRDPQLSLLDIPVSIERTSTNQSNSRPRVFEQPDPGSIFIGKVRLRDYLNSAKVKAPFIIRKLLLAQDWCALESRYAPSGRPPYAPMAMMGLIVYGIHKGITSLRRLEEFARTDLGCFWVSGGIAPDHSVIGKFICRHEDQITTELFEALTTKILTQTGSDGNSVAGDGTVIEAACSHYNLLKQEAVQQAQEVTRQKALDHPDDAAHQRRYEQADKTAETMKTRVQKKQAKGQKTDQLCISPTEPDAVMQRQKRGRGSAPSYKPSILVNEGRLILAQALDGSSETAVIPEMLDQSETITGAKTEELMLDAGYCCHSVISESLSRDISLLCPEGHVPGEGKSSQKKYAKGQFQYDEQQDSYRCPAGEQLRYQSSYQGNETNEGYRLYGSPACTDCAQRDHCTTAKAGRRIKRYSQDEWKEALRLVMGQKQAKARFSKRQAWVEPVFSVLRGQQNLNRFRRKGLARVRAEFGLHVLAYNIGRLIAFLNTRYSGVLGRYMLLIGQYCSERKIRVRVKQVENIPDHYCLDNVG